MKKCVVIPDSFKGSMTSIEICKIIQGEVARFFPDCETVLLPVADGGEGTVACFLEALGGERVETSVSGPFGEAVDGFYGRFGDLAVIEMAAAAGLPMVEGRMDPAHTSTYGVGELMRHAVDHGAKRLILGMGGSCTNDGGCGCAAALGVRFTDAAGQKFVPVGGTLDRVRGIDVSGARELLRGVEFTAMCDVENPMHGANGAAYIYGPQKGADHAMIEELDRQLVALDAAIRSCLGQEIAPVPGTGAAGALGAGVLAFLGATLKPGIETVLDIVRFDERIRGADAVFTGEGKIDSQSLRGKVVIGVSRRAKRQRVPVYAIVGDVGDGVQGAYDLGVTAVFSINRVAVPFAVARKRSKADLAATMGDVLRLMQAVEEPYWTPDDDGNALETV